MTFEVPSNPSHSMIPHCTPYPAGYPMSHRTPRVPQGTLHPTLHPRGHPTSHRAPHILHDTPHPSGHPMSHWAPRITLHIPQDTPHPPGHPTSHSTTPTPRPTGHPPGHPQTSPKTPPSPRRTPPLANKGQHLCPLRHPKLFSPLLMRGIWGDTSPPSSRSSPGLCQAAPCRPDSAPGQGLRAKPWRSLSLPC